MCFHHICQPVKSCVQLAHGVLILGIGNTRSFDVCLHRSTLSEVVPKFIHFWADNRPFLPQHQSSSGEPGAMTHCCCSGCVGKFVCQKSNENLEIYHIFVGKLVCQKSNEKLVCEILHGKLKI